MLERLIDFAVHRRVAVLVATAVFAVFGVVTFRKLKIEAFPDVTNVQVMVISLYPGQAAEEVEKQVTIPVERALVGRAARAGPAVDHVVRAVAGHPDLRGRRRHLLGAPAGGRAAARAPRSRRRRAAPGPQRHARGAGLPVHAGERPPHPQRAAQLAGLGRVEAPDARAGVADVVSFGGFQKEYHVLADPAQLRNNGLALRKDLMEAVSRSNGATSGGYLPHGESEFVVRGRGYLRYAADIENTVMTRATARPCWCATSRRSSRRTPRRGAVARGEAVDSVEGTILLRRGENPKDVLTGVHQAVERINREILPPGMKIVPFYDRTRLVDTTLRTVSHNMIEGVALVSVVLWIFLRAISGSLAVAITMPLALLTAFVGLYYAGVPANLLSMGAIDFGILLDGAVILVENAYRHLAEEQPPPEEVPAVVARAAKEVVRPTLFSMSIIGAAMMPIFTLERVEGRIFRPVALTYAFALLGALFFTMTAVPALTAVLLAQPECD